MIETEWRRLRPIRPRGATVEEELQPPWGVWIRQFAALPPEADSANCTYEDALSRIRAVWFLDERGLATHGVWEHHRYVTVHFRRPWTVLWVETSLPSSHLYNPIGTATIAPYEDSDDWYLDYQWGGLFGRGYRVKVGVSGAIGLSEIWTS